MENFQCCFGDIGGLHGTWDIGGCLATGNITFLSAFYGLKLNNHYFKRKAIRSNISIQIRPFPVHYAKGETKEDSAIVQILKFFSVNINGRAVLNTDPPGPGHISCMNGIR